MCYYDRGFCTFFHMFALDINGFTKAYGEKTAVNGITLQIEPGEFFGFLGPNGAGKTTTISCTTGTASITGGSIKVFGLDVAKDFRAARQKIGLSPQEFNVDIFAPIYKTLWYTGGYYGIPKKKRHERIVELFKIFDLTQFTHQPFRTLSGGYKRRVMLARAMIHDPELLILDEPTAGVDVELRHELWKYLQRINSEGKTILLTSHYLEEVERLCNRIAIINGGNIEAIGDKSKFIGGGKSLEQRYLEITKKV